MQQATVASATDLHSATALKLVQASAKALADFAAQPVPVKDWQAAHTAYKVQRLAAGVDREGAEVRVSLAMFASGGRGEDDGPAWEVDAAT